MTLPWWLVRLKYRWKFAANSAYELNKRVEVEQTLLRVAAGKRPLLSKEECSKLAYKLGVTRDHAEP